VPLPALSEQEELLCRMTEVDTGLQRWQALEGYSNETMGTVDLVHFWKVSGFLVFKNDANTLDRSVATSSRCSTEPPWMFFPSRRLP
jgi:hypothetical protein